MKEAERVKLVEAAALIISNVIAKQAEETHPPTIIGTVRNVIAAARDLERYCTKGKAMK